MEPFNDDLIGVILRCFTVGYDKNYRMLKFYMIQESDFQNILMMPQMSGT